MDTNINNIILNGPSFSCPICHEALKHPECENRYVCQNNHSFDISRKGHINLLPSNRKNSKIPGDSADMVHARTSFLNEGYYEGFSDGINRLAADALRGRNSADIADAGCGEGYYTKRLVHHLTDASLAVTAAGFDLSKDAIAHAASITRNMPGVRFAVASLFEMPLRDSSVDLILNLFAPVADDEFARVLRPGGFLIMAVPAKEHLFGLKCAIYDNPYKNTVRRDELEHFRLERIENVTYDITLRSREDIMNLFTMTPYFWKTSVSDKARLEALDTLTTALSFDLLLYRKIGG